MKKGLFRKCGKNEVQGKNRFDHVTLVNVKGQSKKIHTPFVCQAIMVRAKIMGNLNLSYTNILNFRKKVYRKRMPSR